MGVNGHTLNGLSLEQVAESVGGKITIKQAIRVPCTHLDSLRATVKFMKLTGSYRVDVSQGAETFVTWESTTK